MTSDAERGAKSLHSLAASPWNVSDRRLIAIILLLLSLAGLYFALVDGGDTLKVRAGWTTVALVNLVAWVWYVGALWLNRGRLVRLDYHMLYLPIGAWLVADVAVRLLAPLVIQPLGWSSGSAEKGAINTFFESGLVAMLYGLYLMRLTRPDAGARQIALWARVVIACAVAVAFFAPPLGE